MSVTDELFTKKWDSIIGRLPEGFFVQVNFTTLSLFFNGPGYEQVMQPSGRRPAKGEERALIKNFDISGAGRSVRVQTRDEIRATAELAARQIGAKLASLRT